MTPRKPTEIYLTPQLKYGAICLSIWLNWALNKSFASNFMINRSFRAYCSIHCIPIQIHNTKFKNRLFLCFTAEYKVVSQTKRLLF